MGVLIHTMTVTDAHCTGVLRHTARVTVTDAQSTGVLMHMVMITDTRTTTHSTAVTALMLTLTDTHQRGLNTNGDIHLHRHYHIYL